MRMLWSYVTRQKESSFLQKDRPVNACCDSASVSVPSVVDTNAWLNTHVDEVAFQTFTAPTDTSKFQSNNTRNENGPQEIIPSRHRSR